MEQTTLVSLTDAQINELAAEQPQKPDHFQTALREEMEEEEKEKIKVARSKIKRANSIMNAYLEELREHRKREEIQKKKVAKLGAAHKQFLEDGNYDAFMKVFNEI